MAAAYAQFYKAILGDFLSSPTPAQAVLSASVLLGLGVIAYVAVYALLALAHALWPAKNLRKYGEWAVVTGATDGIGLAYAKQLAKRGISVVLISRSAERLATAEAEIKAKYPAVLTKTVAADFSSTDPALYTNIAKQIEGLDIGILVNNVGLSYPSALFFHELPSVDAALADNIIAVNVTATTRMTALVVPGMVKKGKGAIINISSAAGRIPAGNPLYAVYSASKAYVDYFSRSLHYELKPLGVHVQCQSPYFVTSKMSKIKRASLTVPDPNAFAAAAAKAIGCGASVVPFWTHCIEDSIIRSIPAAVSGPLLTRLHKGIRAAFFRKRAAGEKKEQ